MTGKAAPPGNPERILKQKLGRFSGGRILDVATGHGDFALLLVRVFADYEEIVGIDTNDQALKEARAAARRAGHNPIPRDCHPLSAEENGGCTCLPQSGLCPKPRRRFRFQRMDAQKLNFPDASFDTAAISNSLHHLPEPKAVLADMLRVLKPGGLLVVREMYCDGLNEAQRSHLLFHHLRADIDTANGVFHRHSYPRRVLERMYRGIGLAGLRQFDLGPGDDDPLKTEAPEHIIRMLDTWLQAAGHNPIPRDCHPLSAEENGGCTCLPQSGLCPKAAGHAGVPGRLVRRIERIKAHIRRHGFLPSSSLVCLGRKAGTGPPRAPKTK